MVSARQRELSMSTSGIDRTCIQLRSRGVDGSEQVNRHRGSSLQACSPLAISKRDARIIDAALEKIGKANVSFGDALRALRESVEEQIPDGRIFLLGHTAHGQIVGSIISGLGIADGPTGLQLVRAKPGELPRVLGSLVR